MKELTVCPICHEDSAFIETEGGWCVYVQCGHCGTHTAFHSFHSDEEKEKAERAVVQLWNMGKVMPVRLCNVFLGYVFLPNRPSRSAHLSFLMAMSSRVSTQLAAAIIRTGSR